MYKAFVRAKSGCDKWHDYEMTVAPYENGKPIYYEFTSCPAAEFTIRHGLTDIMPALRMWIMRPWNCSMQGLYGRPPA